MKKIILTFGLIAFLGLSATSCSTDDSALETTTNDLGTGTTGTGTGGSTDNGDKDLPKPPQHP